MGIVKFERFSIEFLVTKLSFAAKTTGGGGFTTLAGIFCCEDGGELTTGGTGGRTAGLLSLM